MASSASASVRASTGASPAAASTGVATGHSVRQQPNYNFVLNEQATICGGAEHLVILDEQIENDGTHTTEVEPAAKK
jgi:hypothetical protein